MIERSLLLVLLALLASCVPPAAAREDLPEPSRLSLEDIRHLPPARLPAVIDSATAVGPAARPFEAGQGAAFGSALDCLTAAVYYEARSEPLDGQRAVAQVVLNRVRHQAFPGSVCGVVFQGQHRRTGCQFSFTCDGAMRRSREPAAWERSRRVAEAALSGYVYVPVGLATHFHTTSIRAWWASSMRRAITVGSHIFYRWPGRWGDPMSFRQPYAGGEGGLPRAAPGGTDAIVARNIETVMGVTIHRGTGAPSVSPRLAERPADRAAPRRAVVNGVRVHRGGGGDHDVRIRAGIPDAELAVAAPVSSGGDGEGVAAR